MVGDLFNGRAGVGKHAVGGQISVVGEAHCSGISEHCIVVEKRPDRDLAAAELCKPLIPFFVQLRLTDGLELCLHISGAVGLLLTEPFHAGGDLRIRCVGGGSLRRKYKNP